MAAAFAVALTAALSKACGPKRTRLVAQVVAAAVGVVFIIGLQVAAILSYGTLSRSDVLQSPAVLAPAPDLGSVFWWPARAVVLGDGVALAVPLAAGSFLLAGAIALVAPRFGEYTLAAAGTGSAVVRSRHPSPSARPRHAARCAASRTATTVRSICS